MTTLMLQTQQKYCNIGSVDSKQFKKWRNYSAPLGFCSLARREKRRIRSIWFICEDSSIAATPAVGQKTRGAE